ncbi:MAG: hypothetical protein SFX72_15290 [Isosphaeraceae bacterium]|nr:hypothetical protein [Isosphaeraceae bacterium]
MAIRFLLVSFVASMGLEMPSRNDVASFVESGRTWIASRMEDWSITNARAAESAKERAFARIVDEMSRDFSRDLARLESKTNAPATPNQTFEPILVEDAATDVVSSLIAQSTSPDFRIEVADSDRQGLVDELNAFADGLDDSIPETAPAALATQVTVSAGPAAEAVELEVARANPSESESPVASSASTAPESEGVRIERLASAIRLTREAVGAWASLLQGGDAIVSR